MSIKVASHNECNTEKIISEINQADVKAVLYFFSPSFAESGIQEKFAKAFPKAVCIGASMIGGWSSEKALDSGITAMSISSNEIENVYLSFQEGVKKDPIGSARAAISELKKQIKNQHINPDEYLGLIFFDGLCLGEIIMKEFSMDQDFNMAFAGGAAADELTFTRTFVSAGDRISDDGLVSVILKMKIPFYFNHYVHYIPTDVSFTITRVETMKRIAWEINGEPAAQVYARQIGISDISALNASIFAKNPLGLNFGSSIYVRSPNAVIDGKGLQFYCYIEAGTKVFLLKQGDILAHAQNSITDAQQFLPGIQGCLLFNCVLRYLELKELGGQNSFNNIFRGYPMIGFNTYGEELFTHHNQTLTAVFFGIPPEKGSADPYKTKRLFHYTDSKLKSLVFDIVSRSELLNITISYLKESMDLQSDEILSGDRTLKNYETIRKSLGAMIEQSNISKEDIERMLVVYQNNVGKTRDYVFSIVDEINSQNQRLVELRKEADTANRTKSSFLAAISHEIRTPLNAIIGIAQIEMQDESLPEKYMKAYEKILNSGSSLLGIINDLLDMTKMETGKLELNLNEYDTPSFINDTVHLNIVRIGSKAVDFKLDIDENLPQRLYGDELRIKQILNNLLSNAIKYTEKGYVTLCVRGEVMDQKIKLILSVTDTGQGMKESDIKKLFTEYSRFNTEENRSTEGTGLGLNITKKLADMMNGTISVKSEYGKGSVFTVTIPQKIVNFSPIGKETAKQLVNFTFTGINENKDHIVREQMPYGRVLVVDDVDTNLYVANGLLSLYGLNVELADSGFKAIEKTKNGGCYDIIFMDQMMPRMDGIETVRRLRESGYAGTIIALTANAMTGNEELFAEKGFDGFIPKPIDIKLLNAALNKFVRDRHPLEAAKYKPETAATQEKEIDPRVKTAFLEDAKKAVSVLSETSKAGGDTGLFTVTAHAMKSVLAVMGEIEASRCALNLENAGHKGDTGYIIANTGSFIKTLEELIKKFSI